MNHDKKVGFGGKSTMRCLLTTLVLLALAWGTVDYCRSAGLCSQK